MNQDYCENCKTKNYYYEQTPIDNLAVNNKQFQTQLKEDIDQLNEIKIDPEKHMKLLQ